MNVYKNINNIFFIFALSHLVIWTLVPSLTNKNLPLDTIEALAWGSNLVNKTLKKSINSLEKVNDQKLIWRKYVNQQLNTKYKKLYAQLNCLIYLKAKNFGLLQKWRLKQENKLWLKTKNKSSHKIMNKGKVINFMQTYQRITQNMFKYAPKYSSIILNLNSNHQIKTIKYNK